MPYPSRTRGRLHRESEHCPFRRRRLLAQQATRILKGAERGKTRRGAQVRGKCMEEVIKKLAEGIEFVKHRHSGGRRPIVRTGRLPRGGGCHDNASSSSSGVVVLLLRALRTFSSSATIFCRCCCTLCLPVFTTRTFHSRFVSPVNLSRGVLTCRYLFFFLFRCHSSLGSARLVSLWLF